MLWLYALRALIFLPLFSLQTVLFGGDEQAMVLWLLSSDKGFWELFSDDATT